VYNNAVHHRTSVQDQYGDVLILQSTWGTTKYSTAALYIIEYYRTSTEILVVFSDSSSGCWTGNSGGIRKNPGIPGFFLEFTQNSGSKKTGNLGSSSGKTEFQTGNNN
jgi:hypothetical protein